MKKRFLAALFALILLGGLLPAGSAEEWVSIDKVNIETYPGPNMGNELPTVGQQVSKFYATTITPGISVTGCTLVDDDGVTCTGEVENKNYTLTITVTSNIVNYIFTSNTKAYINNVASTIVPSEDGFSATVSRYIRPNIIDPVIYKNPKDESHVKSEVFSFTASASQVFDSFQWYIMSTYGEKFTPEELAATFPGVQAIVSDQGGGAVRLNIYNPADEMNGWLVYCVFKGFTENPISTTKATINITDAEKTEQVRITPVPSPEESPTAEEESELPEGITIVDPPPEVTETPVPEETPAPTEQPSPTPEPSATPTPEQSLSEKVAGSKTLQLLKWIGIVVAAVLVLAGIVLFLSYLHEKNKKKRRRKMAGRGNRKN